MQEDTHEIVELLLELVQNNADNITKLVNIVQRQRKQIGALKHQIKKVKK